MQAPSREGAPPLSNAAVQLATAYVSLVVSTKGLGSDVAKELGNFEKQVDKTGKSASSKLGAAFKKKNIDTKPDQDELKKLEAAIERSSKTVTKAKQTEEDATRKVAIAQKAYEEAVSKSGDGSSRALAAQDRLIIAQRKAEAAAHQTKAALDGEKNALDDLAREAGKTEDKIEGFGAKFKNSFSGAVSKVNPFSKFKGEADAAGEKTGKSMGGLLGTKLIGAFGALGVGMALADAVSAGFDETRTAGKLAASLNLNPEQAEVAGKIAGDLYGQGFGDSVGDVGVAIDAVMSSLGKDLPSDQIEAFTEKALNLATTFDVDVSESLATVKTLIENGLAKDGSEALDLLTGALQNMPAHVRDEAIPALSEYSKHFATLGIDGERTVGMLAAASDQGVIGVDKMGDAVKEFGIRATDMSKTSVDAFASMGLDAEHMANDLLKGGKVGEEAFDLIISSLQSIEDPAEQANTAIALFGTPLEDLGVDKVPAFLDSLKSTESGLGDLTGSAEKLAEQLGDQISPIEKLKRGFTTLVSDALGPLMDAGQGVIDILFKGEFSGGIFGLKEDDPIIDTLFNIRDGFIGITDILFKGEFNSPFLGMEEDSGFVDFLFDVRESAEDLVGAFSNLSGPGGAVEGVLEGIRDAAGSLLDVWSNKFAPIFSSVWGTITSAVEENGPKIEGVFSRIKDAFSKLGDTMSAIGGVLSAVWSAIAPTVLPIIDGFIGAIIGIWDGLWQYIGGVMDLITSVLTGDWEGALTAMNDMAGGQLNILSSAFGWMKDTVIGIVTGLGDGLKGIWDGIWSWTITKVGQIRDGVVNGFRDMKDKAVYWLTNLWTDATKKVGEIKDSVLKVFGDLWTGAEKAFGAGVAVVADVLDGIREAAAKPIRFVIETVFNDGIIAGINSLASNIGMGKVLSPIPVGFAQGGILPGTSSFRQGDDQLIMARRGEGVTVSEALQDPYEKKRLLALNQAALRGQDLNEFRDHFDGFAAGGIVNYRGVRMDGLSTKMLYAAEKMYGGAFSPTQGSFRPRTSYSGGTHMGAGAVDLRSPNTRQVMALRRVGSAAWDRTGKGPWMPHTHAIFPVPGLSPSAAGQLSSYRRGGDGLGGRDNGPGVGAINGLLEFGSKLWDMFEKAGEAVWDFVSAPVEMFKDAVSGGMDKLSSIPGGGVISDVVSKIPNLVIGGIQDWFMDQVGLGDEAKTTHKISGTVEPISGFARGGFVPGGPILVGENGPEIISPPRGSYVTPNHALGSGEQNVNIENLSLPGVATFQEFEAFVEGLRNTRRLSYQKVS